ncbi:hypothetical protein BC832DRAFT_544356 [Gaertneriomyces semiglobifer]|nr:hypothetical protein BC832DRAFT_544356 [Gaertneriomyces semiglobifer]
MASVLFGGRRLITRAPTAAQVCLSTARYSTIEPAVVSPPSAGFVRTERVIQPRSRGFLRGGLLGFLLGITLSGGSAYVYLLDEYQQSANAVLTSVEELQKSTAKLKDHTKKIETLERDLAAHAKRAASVADVEALRSELLKVIDDLNVQHLELKTQVWEIDHDLKTGTK